MEAENLQEGLQKPISSNNKGFTLLQKMGFNPGVGLGKDGELSRITSSSTKLNLVDGNIFLISLNSSDELYQVFFVKHYKV